ncbi:MAG: methionyl-tRNA formyltransferase [Planctomycetota bacterium]
MTLLRIIFGGAGPFADGVFDTLTGSTDIEIMAVVTTPDKPAGRGKKLHEQDLSVKARERGLRVLKFPKIGAPTALTELTGFGATAFLTASYGQKLPKLVLDAFAEGCWNLHPSLLPEFRGASPVQGALLAGKRITGVTLFKMVESMDAGPIAGSHATEIGDEETAGTLLERLAHRAGLLARSALPYAARGHLPLDKQDHAAASYASKLTKADGRVDFSLDAPTLHNRIRAVTPWPGAFCSHLGETIQLAGSRVAQNEGTTASPGTLLRWNAQGLEIACGRGVLGIQQLQRAGRRWMTAADFVNGARLKAGDIIRP